MAIASRPGTVPPLKSESKRGMHTLTNSSGVEKYMRLSAAALADVVLEWLWYTEVSTRTELTLIALLLSMNTANRVLSRDTSPVRGHIPQRGTWRVAPGP